MEIRIGPWKLRPWQPGDVDALVKYANNRAIWINLTDRFPSPYTQEDADYWIRFASHQDPLTNLAISTQDEAIGSIGLTLQDGIHSRSAEVGYWLAEPFWGQGIATKALKAFSEYAFESFNLTRLYAIVFEWNIPSTRVLEKVGFSCEARMRKSAVKDGKTADEFLYGLVRE